MSRVSMHYAVKSYAKEFDPERNRARTEPRTHYLHLSLSVVSAGRRLPSRYPFRPRSGTSSGTNGARKIWSAVTLVEVCFRVAPDPGGKVGLEDLEPETWRLPRTIKVGRKLLRKAAEPASELLRQLPPSRPPQTAIVSTCRPKRVGAEVESFRLCDCRTNLLMTVDEGS